MSLPCFQVIRPTTLDAALDAGHAASHRGHCPNHEELDHVMDIVESIIVQMYVLPEAGKRLKHSIPPRKKRSAGTVDLPCHIPRAMPKANSGRRQTAKPPCIHIPFCG